MTKRWLGPAALATMTVALGVVDLVSALTPEDMGRLEALREFLPLSVAHVASAGTAVAGVLLMMLGHGLRRRKRRAWRVAVALLAVSGVLHVIKGLDVEEATVAFTLLVVLVAQRAQFYAAPDPRSRWRAPVAFVALTVSSFALGMFLIAAHQSRIVGSPSATQWAQHVLLGLVGIRGPLRFTAEGTQDVVAEILFALGAMTLAVTAYLALRTSEPAARLTDDDERQLRGLLAKHGARDSLGYFALRRDKAVVFSATGKAAISYRVVSGVMLASGDPLGDVEAWPGAIRAFVEQAGRHAWVPAVMGCSEVGAEVWAREANVHVLELGDEAVVQVGDFSLQGRSMRNVRQMVARVERAGYTAQVRRLRQLTPLEIDEMRRQVSAWRGAVVERGFSMALGRYGDPADGDCVVVTAHKDGQLAAILHFVPWAENGLSLDLMRRDREADPGLNELLIVTMLRAAPELGIAQVSLNFAVFRSALERGGRLGAGPILRAWRGALLFASRWFQIDSLYRFNAKFCPQWEPRFVCYPGPRDIPRVTLAVLEAEAFLVWPHQWLVLRRRSRTTTPALFNPSGAPAPVPR